MDYNVTTASTWSTMAKVVVPVWILRMGQMNLFKTMFVFVSYRVKKNHWNHDTNKDKCEYTMNLIPQTMYISILDGMMCRKNQLIYQQTKRAMFIESRYFELSEYIFWWTFIN